MKEARHKRPPIVKFHLYEMPRKGKSIETEGKLAVTWGLAGVGEEVTAKGH